jgi:predicted permease
LNLALATSVRLALRRLAAGPAFAAVAIASLALAIGANTALFSLVDAVLMRKPPFRQPERLVDAYLAVPEEPYNVFSYPDYRDLRDGTRSTFDDLGAARLVLVQLDRGGRIEMLVGQAQTGNYFEMLGVPAALGRPLHASDDVTPGGHQVAVLGHGFWRRSLGGDPAVVGQTLRISGKPYTVVGVMDPRYTGSLRGIEPALYLPMMMINQIMPDGDDLLEARGQHALFVKGRLRSGATLAEAVATAQAVAADLAGRRVENWSPQSRFHFVATQDVIIYPPLDRFVRAAAWLLTSVAALVLLLACTNLAGVLLAHAVDRRKEVAVKLALGAARRTIVAQFLVESLVLSSLGGLAGIGVAHGFQRVLLGLDLPLPIPVTLDLRVGGPVLAFCVGASLLAGLLVGMAPALQAAREDIAGTLRDETAGGGGRARTRLRGVLVVAQVAASVVLLVGAGLFLRSLGEIQRADPGFGRAPAAVMTIAVPADRYPPAAGRVFVRSLRERIARIPGVEAVGLTGNLHLDTLNRSTIDINVDGVPPPAGQEGFGIDVGAVDEGFFDAIGIPILSGRGFAETDTEDTPKVVVVNEAFVQRFWPAGDALGRVIRRKDGDLTVIGVAGNAAILRLGEAPRPFIYRSYGQSYAPFISIVARTAIDPQAVAQQLPVAARTLDPEAWVWETKTLARHLAIVRLPARLAALLVSAFAVVAMILAVIGLYGVVSHAVAQRVREMGVRMAMGADALGIVRLLMGGGIRLAAIGVAIGVPFALVMAQLLRGLLFGVQPFDPLTLGVVVATLAATATLASYLAAHRATRIDPMVALRSE